MDNGSADRKSYRCPSARPSELSGLVRSNMFSEVFSSYNQAFAAIAHDLQSPITRMKLRAELSPASHDRDKMMTDLDEIEHLVRQGLAYARNAHAPVEDSKNVNINSVVESLVFDYQDAGRPVSIVRTLSRTMETKPQSLRRIMSNLIDNSLKYAGPTTVSVERAVGATLRISVEDRGPGIPEDQLRMALEPFVQLDNRDEERSGSGLGLTISSELCRSIGAVLNLRNRDGGGLSAQVLM